MADQTDDSTTTPADEGLDPAALPQGTEDAAAEDDVRVAEAGEDDDAGEQAAAVEELAAAEEEAESPEPATAEPDEAPVSPFGAQFSSPEPTAVIARPRRRATRPAGADRKSAV